MKVAGTIVIPLDAQVDAWLERCVQSALDQSVPSEVIVATSPSAPDSNKVLLRRMAARSPLLRVVPRRPGLAVGLNAGIAAASSKRVGFLIPSDWLGPQALERCTLQDADIVSTQLANYAADGTTALGIERRITNRGLVDQATLEAKASYLSPFYLYRRDALLRVGGVDESLGDTGPDDFDLPWTLLENGATVAVVEEVLYFRRFHRTTRPSRREPDFPVADLRKIFDKHRVYGAERRQLMAKHARRYAAPPPPPSQDDGPHH